ncbi:MAG: asparaginase [Gemmatimonadetes bacterium]|nr:asparaginase [Gemmatimonadota bacterium]
MADARVEVWRGALLESQHRVSVAVADARGRLRARAGDAELVVFARSAAKPFQALPLVDDGVAERFELSGAELALCCASHNGEPLHVDAARSILRKIGTDEDALACGPHPPLHEPSARALQRIGAAPGRLHNNCSGKHGGMLALARTHAWPLTGYHRSDHPVQQRMLEEVSRWTELTTEELPTAVDGCGVVTFGLPLAALAGAFARLSAAARGGERAPATVVQAMVRHPEYVGGTDRLCTELMRVVGGRIFTKVGAEGVYCAGVPGAELGVALKVEDGSKRAAEPALLAVLRALGLLLEDELARLSRYAEPDVINTRGEAVGRIRATVELEPGRG